MIGCTHFSFLVPMIRRVAGAGVRIVDPARSVAAQTARVARSRDESGHLMLFASGDTEEFSRLASTVAGVETGQPVLPFPS